MHNLNLHKIITTIRQQGSSVVDSLRFYPKKYDPKRPEKNIYKLDVSEEMIEGLINGLSGSKEDTIFHCRILKKCNVSENYEKVINKLVESNKWKWENKQTLLRLWTQAK